MPRERRSKYANDAKDTAGIASQVESLSSSLAQKALQSDVTVLQANKVDKGGNEQVTLSMLSQQVKESMTGGSVALVGVDGVNKSNIVSSAITKNKLDPTIQNLLRDQHSEVVLNLINVGFYGRAGQNFTTVGYLKQELSVTAGETYQITGYSYLSMPLYVLVDGSGAVVDYFPISEDSTQTIYKNVTITIPNNVVGLRINKTDHVSYPVLLSKATSYLVKGESIAKDYRIYGKQMYDSSMIVNGYWITPEGTIGTNVNSKYAKVPVKPNETISLTRNDARTFGASSSGSLLFLDSNGNILSFIDPINYLNNETYNDYKYITFITPDNCEYIAYTTKLNTSYDISNTLFITYGNEISQDIIDNNKIYKIDALLVVDEGARQSIEAYKKPYLGKKWVVVGDSLTEFNLRASLNYHDYIATDEGFTVTNMGKSGTGYMRTQDVGFAFYQRILNITSDVDVVTVFGSFNDLGGGYALGEVTDTGTTTICGCINTFFDNYYSKLPTIPLGVILPTPWVTNYPSVVNADNYVSKLIEICKKRSVPYLDLYHGSNLRPWDANYRTLMYSKDEGNGVHPDENGHKMLSPKIREFVKSLI
jgi:lysophospholipase L1-like esterase